MVWDLSSGLFFSFVIFCLICTWGNTHRQNEKRRNVPPGHSGLSAVLESIVLLRAYLRRELYEYLEDRYRTFGPVFRTSLFWKPLVFLDGSDGNKFVFTNDMDLKDYYYSTVRQVLVQPHGLHSMSTERRRNVKRFLSARILGPDHVADFIKQSELLAKDHLQKYWLNHKDGTIVNVSDLVAGYFSGVLAKEFLSLADGQESRNLQHLLETVEQNLVSLVPLKVPGTSFYRSFQARVQLNRIAEAALLKSKKDLNDGRGSTNQDILSRMLTRSKGHDRSEAHDNLLLTDKEIATVLVDLLLAGNMATAKLISTIIRNLGRFPDVYQVLIREHEEFTSRKVEGEPLSKQDLQAMVCTSQVIQETLRRAMQTDGITPPIREVTKTLHYKGYTIPKGWKISVPYGQVPDNKRFDPSRWNQPNGGAGPHDLPMFGLGSKFCPGEDFAKMNILVFLHWFLKSVRWENLDTPTNRGNVLYSDTSKCSSERTRESRVPSDILIYTTYQLPELV